MSADEVKAFLAKIGRKGGKASAATGTPMGERGKLGQSNRTPEQRREAARKAWETRRKK